MVSLPFQVTHSLFLEEDIKLKDDFRISLPHCLTQNKVEQHGVSFAKANHNDYITQNGQIKYQFESCGNFSIDGDHKLTLQANHCCFYCITANYGPQLSLDIIFCLARIEKRTSESSVRDICFVALFFLDTCIMTIEEQYTPYDDYVFKYDCFKFKQENNNLCMKIMPKKWIQWEKCTVMEPLNAEVHVYNKINIFIIL